MQGFQNPVELSNCSKSAIYSTFLVNGNSLYQFVFLIDSDECLSLPCGPRANSKCSNTQGSYECSACDEGLLLYQNPVEERRCVGMYCIEQFKFYVFGLVKVMGATSAKS